MDQAEETFTIGSNRIPHGTITRFNTPVKQVVPQYKPVSSTVRNTPASRDRAGVIKITTNEVDPVVYSKDAIDNIFGDVISPTAEGVGAIPVHEKGKALGVATLNDKGKVLEEQLPSSLNTPKATPFTSGTVKTVGYELDPYVYTVGSANSAFVSSSSFNLNDATDGAVLAFNSLTGKYEPVVELRNTINDGGYFQFIIYSNNIIYKTNGK